MGDELRRRSLRILVDLQACQTAASGTRGVGRYSGALFSGIAARRGRRDLFALASAQLAPVNDALAVDASHVVHYIPPAAWDSPRDFLGGEEDTLDGLALSSFIAPLKPDILHVSHVFEGFGERVAIPAHQHRAEGQIVSATLYDLIPLLYQDYYFQSEQFRKFYYSRMGWLRQADLLLAISESSRQDAIHLLGIEPWRIVTIHGGIFPQFRPAADPEALRRDLRQRYGLKERIVLYTGGDDHRKNIRGALEGFAAVAPDSRRDCQLVIVCAMQEQRKKMYLDYAFSAGLKPDDVVITGFVSEDDLVAFYATCDLFIFPSLYEGLGLPVLEAMACGAPAIGGDNSSIRELIVRRDAMFDSSSTQSIAQSITSVLNDKGLSDDLRSYGLKRAQDFTWQRSASLALEAFDEALARARTSGVSAAVQGWLPRKRMAVFTPLPPCRSGIADYNAKFLPYLARHFSIDLYVDNYKVADETLTSAFRVFNASDFPPVAQSYDVILYEFGNSEFHMHMLPLLEKYPGVVGLHDAYLSGLFGYLDFHMGQAGRFAGEMLYSHGPLAGRLFAPVKANPMANTDAMINLPCTKRVMDQATGIISHSPFNLDLAREFYPEGWQAPYRIIPQMVIVPEALPEAERNALRKELGFGENDTVIATFGHIAWTKWGDRLLEAFLNSSLREEGGIYLVYAGELSKEDFSVKLKASIKNAGLGNRIRITGFLSEADYERYLHITDIAIQLRTKSRGGTPKGVLDCLAYGVPVVVNNDASYKDYPDNVVVKLEAEPSAQEIAEKLISLATRKELRGAYSRDGLAYIRAHHDPAHCAAEYAAAIHEFIGRDTQLRQKTLVNSFAPHLAACAEPRLSIQSTLDWLRYIPAYPFRRRRLLIDVSHIAQSDHKTGIPRVVKQIVQSIYCTRRLNIEPLAIELVDGVPHIANDWLERQGMLPAGNEREQLPDGSAEFRAGDILLMLDSSWERYQEFFPIISQARANNVPVYTVVYDLLPLTLPPGNIVSGGAEWFERWFRDAIRVSDGLICISRAVAQDVSDFLRLKAAPTASHPRIGYWHLGSDFHCQKASELALDPAIELKAQPYLLMVGTLEPRKSHALALDAMEKLWAKGHELCLCIVGKEGWMVTDLIGRLKNHPLRSKKLFFLEQAKDSDIAALYANAAGLLFLSKGEGFGLPLVEAANYKIPIVCSDIPVFHEIAGEFATYVDNHDAGILAGELENWWGRKQAGQLPDTQAMPRLTWEQSAEALLDVIYDNHWIEGNT